MAHLRQSELTIPRNHTYARSATPSGSSSTNASSTTYHPPRFLRSTSPDCFFFLGDRAILLAAEMTFELHDNILFYVTWGYEEDSLSCVLEEGHTRFPRWCRPEVIACSLVCRHWANRSRQYLFSGATLIVSSIKEAERLVHYALHGCPSLVPVHTLISGIRVHQRYAGSCSFLHRVSLLKSITGKLFEHSYLKIEGPARKEISACKLDTPHWNIPSSIPTPPSLLAYRQLRLVDVHLPSFTHAAKYVSHFQSATEVHLDNLTWSDGGYGDLSPKARIPKRGSYNLGRKPHIFKASRCTGNRDITLQVLLANIHSPLYAISDDLPSDNRRQAMFDWIQEFLLPVSETAHDVEIGTRWTQSAVWINLEVNNWTSTFVSKTYAPSQSPTPDYCVVGLCARRRRSSGESDLKIDDLMLHARLFLLLHAIAIIFDSYEELSLATGSYRPSPFHSLISKGQYILVIRCYKGRTLELESPWIARLAAGLGGNEVYIGIHPITLVPTGQVWGDEDDIIPSLLEIPGP